MGLSKPIGIMILFGIWRAPGQAKKNLQQLQQEKWLPGRQMHLLSRNPPLERPKRCPEQSKSFLDKNCCLRTSSGRRVHFQ